MSVTGSVVAYKDRKIDLLVFQNAGVGTFELVDMFLVIPGTSGLVCTGIVKLAQRFLLELLTEQGTIPYDPLRGTTFMRELRLGLVPTTVDAEISFALALDQAKLRLQLEETDAMPGDERYGRAELLSLTIAPADTLKLRIQLTSLDGTGVTLILPIETTLG